MAQVKETGLDVACHRSLVELCNTVATAVNMAATRGVYGQLVADFSKLADFLLGEKLLVGCLICLASAVRTCSPCLHCTFRCLQQGPVCCMHAHSAHAQFAKCVPLPSIADDFLPLLQLYQESANSTGILSAKAQEHLYRLSPLCRHMYTLLAVTQQGVLAMAAAAQQRGEDLSAAQQEAIKRVNGASPRAGALACSRNSFSG